MNTSIPTKVAPQFATLAQYITIVVSDHYDGGECENAVITDWILLGKSAILEMGPPI